MKGRKEATKTVWRGRCWMRRLSIQKPLYDRDAKTVDWVQETSILSTQTQAYLIAPSKLPGRKPNPCPISCKNKSPSTSRSNATSGSFPSIQHSAAKGRKRRFVSYLAYSAQCLLPPKRILVRLEFLLRVPNRILCPGGKPVRREED